MHIKSSHDGLPVTREYPERPRDPATVAARELKRNLERLANRLQPKNLPKYRDRVISAREIALNGNVALCAAPIPPEFPVNEPAIEHHGPCGLARTVISPPSLVAAPPVVYRNPIDVAVDKAIEALAARDVAYQAARYGDIVETCAFAPF